MPDDTPAAHIHTQVAEIETVATKRVYSNRWMTVREDTIVRASGQGGIYGVVEKADFVVIAALQDGELHLVEQYRYPVRARYWEFPQGSWEQHAPDPLVLAAAELQEETGLVARSMVHVGRLFPAYGYATQCYSIYLATDLQQGKTQRDVEEEGMVTRAFSVGAVQQMILDGTIQDASTVAAFGLLRLKGLL